MASYAVNQRAIERARELIDDRQNPGQLGRAHDLLQRLDATSA